MRAITLVLLAASLTSPAQVSDQNAVLASIQQLYDAMAAGDTAAARKVLIPEGRVIATRANGSVSNVSQEEFAVRLGSAPQSLLERMWNPVVQVRGNLANVWTEYDFHLGGKFTHCGIDAFSLVRVKGEWKIAGITYTIEPEGCKPSPLGPPAASLR